jgi:hypothetical protein
MIRRRIQNLPRGLQDSEEGEEGPEEGAPGSDLTAPGSPDDFFGGPTDAEDEEDGGESPMALLPSSGEPSMVQVGWSREAYFSENEFVFASAQTESAARVRLVPSKKRVVSGERFGIAVAVDAATPVSHFPITLKYDSKALRVLDVEAGNFLGDRSSSEFMVDFSRPGRIVIGASRLGSNPGVAGQGSIAMIEVEALLEGRTVMKFEKCKVLDQRLRELKPVKRKKAVVFVRAEGSGPSVDGDDEEELPANATVPSNQAYVVVDS